MEIFAEGEINEQSFSNPHRRTLIPYKDFILPK